MGQKKCMEYLQKYEEATSKEIAEEHDFGDKSARSKLKSLVKAGLVEHDRSQIPHIFRITERGREKDTSNMGGMVV